MELHSIRMNGFFSFAFVICYSEGEPKARDTIITIHLLGQYSFYLLFCVPCIENYADYVAFRFTIISIYIDFMCTIFFFYNAYYESDDFFSTILSVLILHP